MAEPKKTAKTKQSSTKATQRPAARPVAQEPASKDPWGWLNGSLLWGVFFIFAGLLFLLANLGVVDIEWREAWKLWPVVIIIVGLSIMSLRGWLSALVYGVSAILIASLVWITLTGGLKTAETELIQNDFSISRESDDVKRLDVNIETGASTLDISSHNGDEMVVGKIESRVSDLEASTELDGDVQEVTLSQKRNVRLFGPGPLNELSVRLNKQLPISLSIDSGASKIEADLSEVMLESLDVDSGASLLELRLGDKHDRTDVKIDTGVSSVTLYVPEDSGVRLTVDSGLSSRDLPDGFKETGKDTYESANYRDAKNKIVINLDMGVSSFKLINY